MNSIVYVKKDSKKKIQISDRILKILSVFFMLIILIEYIFPFSSISAVVPYVSVLVEVTISVYLLFYDNWEMPSSIEGYIAIIYIISTFFFTLIHVGIVSAITAVCKEYFILLVCVFLKDRDYTRDAFDKILKMVLGFAILSLIVAVLFDDMLGKVLGFANVYAADIKSFFISKNQYGRFLYLASICTFCLYMYSKNESKKKWYLIFTGILTLATALTFSRTSLLSLGIFYISFFLITSNENIKRNILFVVIGIVAIVFILNNDFLMNYISRFIIRKDVGIESRSDIWIIGLDYIKQHPLIGAGEFMAEKVINAGGINLFEFHNEYIYRMFVSGIPMTILWCVLVIKRIIVLINNRKINPILNVSSAMFISLGVYMYFEQYGIFQFSITGFMVILFLYIAPNIVDDNMEV